MTPFGINDKVPQTKTSHILILRSFKHTHTFGLFQDRQEHTFPTFYLVVSLAKTAPPYDAAYADLVLLAIAKIYSYSPPEVQYDKTVS